MANLLRMNTDIVRDFSSGYLAQLDEMEQRVQSAQNSVSAMDWISPAREDFVSDFGQLATHIESLIEQGREYSRRVHHEVEEWEALAGLSSAAAIPNTWSGGGTTPAIRPGDSDLWNSLSPLKYVEYLERLEDLDTGLITPAAIFFSMQAGKSGIIGIRASKFVKESILGLNSARKVISGANLVKHVNTVSTVSKALVVMSFAADVYERGQDGLDVPEVGAILAVNAAQYAIGAAVGQVLFPVPGVGAAIGIGVTKAILSVGADIKFLPGGKSIEDVSIDAVHDATHWAIDRVTGN